MRFRLLFMACCFAGCGPPQAVDRVLATGIGGGGGPEDRARTPAPAAAAPVRPRAESGAAACPRAGPTALVDRRDRQTSVPGSAIPEPVARGGSGADAGTGPIDAAMEPTSPPPPDAAPPPPDMAPTPPPPDAPSMPPPMACPMPAADELIASFKGALTTDRVGDRGGTGWSVLTGSDQVPGVAGTVALGTGPARCGNTDFLRFTGTAVATRSPIIRAQLRENSADRPNLSTPAPFKGMRMFLRSTNGGRARLKLPDRNTATIGGVCTLCSDHFALEVDVTSEWQLFKFPFADLKQAGDG